MFFFGDPVEIAQTYLQEAVSEPGPPLEEGELEDLSVKELAHAYVYSRMAWDRARNYDDAPQEVLDAILEVHDELFCHMVARNEVFRENFRRDYHKLLDHSAENYVKYHELFRQYDPSAN